MEDIDGRDIEDAAFLTKGERKNECLGELAFCQRGDIRSHGEDEVFLPRLAGDQADAT